MRIVQHADRRGRPEATDSSAPQWGGRATMFIAGDDADAKRMVTDLLDSFGWDAEDAGGAALARPLEALCQLWCAPGFLRGDWAHAYKVVRP